MTDRLEALVRSAQAARARQAPDPDRVLRALPALVTRRRRRRQAALAGLAALAVLAMVVPAILVRNSAPRPPIAPPSGPPPSVSVPAVPTLTFRPTWVPPGFRETIRAGHVTADEARATQTWTSQPTGVGRVLAAPSMTPAPTGPSISLGIRRRDQQGAPPGGTSVDVGGVTGTYLERAGGTSLLVWAVDGTHLAWLDGSGVPRADLLRVATSVRPDRTAFPPLLKLDWLPAPSPLLHYSLSGDGPVEWNVTLVADLEGMGIFTVMLAQTTDAPEGGEPVPVGTVMGRLIADTEPVTGLPRQIVRVQPPSNPYILTVWFVPTSGPALDRDALLRLVAGIDTDIQADTDWIGGRPS